MLISCPLDCQHLKSWTDWNIITDVEQGRLCDTGDGGGHFGQPLWRTTWRCFALTLQPSIPLPGDILEKPVCRHRRCGHRRCGRQRSDWPDGTLPSAPCPWAPDKFISLPQVFRLPSDNVRPRVRTSISHSLPVWPKPLSKPDTMFIIWVEVAGWARPSVTVLGPGKGQGCLGCYEKRCQGCK